MILISPRFPKYLCYLLLKNLPTPQTQQNFSSSLSMGKFQTEYDLFNCNNQRESFVLSGYYDVRETIDTNVINLTRQYILEQAEIYQGPHACSTGM